MTTQYSKISELPPFIGQPPGSSLINIVSGSASYRATIIQVGTANPASLPAGGTTGQALLKNSNADYDTHWVTTAGLGTVTSVGLALPSSVFSVSNTPITAAGTFTGSLITQSPNTFFSGAASGTTTPTFRAITGADLPSPSPSALGGVKSYAPTGSLWLKGLGTDGIFTATQPTFSNLSGVATVPQGGTGTSTLTSFGLLVGQGTSPIAVTSALTNGQLLVGQTSSNPVPTTIIGDISLTSGGTTTVNKIQNTTVSGVTGSGNVVFSASPTLTGTLNVANASATGIISTSNSTPSVSTSSGAIRGTGGLGIGGDSYFGGELYGSSLSSRNGTATGTNSRLYVGQGANGISVGQRTNSGSYIFEVWNTTQAIAFRPGATSGAASDIVTNYLTTDGVLRLYTDSGGNTQFILNVDGSVLLSKNLQSTSSSTGTLRVIGGAGITGNIFGGGTIYSSAATPILGSKTTITNGAGTATGTLTNAPTATNPTKWLPYDDNGTIRYIPAW